AGRADNAEGIGSLLDMPVDQLSKALEIKPPIRMHGRDEGHHAALEDGNSGFRTSHDEYDLQDSSGRATQTGWLKLQVYRIYGRIYKNALTTSSPRASK